MGVDLVAHIPHDLVLRRIEKVVKRHGELNDTEAGPEMTAGHRNRVDGFRTQLISDLLKLIGTELFEILGAFDLI